MRTDQDQDHTCTETVRQQVLCSRVDIDDQKTDQRVTSGAPFGLHASQQQTADLYLC